MTFRYNIATDNVSIHFRVENISGKPRAYSSAKREQIPTHLRPARVREKNPFDLDNAHMVPPLYYCSMDPNPEFEHLALIRAFDNKFPILNIDHPEELKGQQSIPIEFQNDTHPSLPAYGLQEVVVQHWSKSNLHLRARNHLYMSPYIYIYIYIYNRV